MFLPYHQSICTIVQHFHTPNEHVIASADGPGNSWFGDIVSSNSKRQDFYDKNLTGQPLSSLSKVSLSSISLNWRGIEYILSRVLEVTHWSSSWVDWFEGKWIERKSFLVSHCKTNSWEAWARMQQHWPVSQGLQVAGSTFDQFISLTTRGYLGGYHACAPQSWHIQVGSPYQTGCKI